MLRNAVAGALLAAFAAGHAVADTMLWEVTSEYPYRVQIEFYSQDRPHAWPGDGQAYDLNDYETHTFEQRIGLYQAGEDSFGEHLDPGGRAHHGLVPDPVPDESTDRLAEKCGHVTRRRPRGQPAGLEHQDASPLQPGLLQQAQRHPGGFPSAGSGLDNRPDAAQERLPDGGKEVVDGQRG